MSLKLKEELVKSHGLAADASDTQVKDHARKLMNQGKISAKQVAALLKSDNPNGKGGLPERGSDPDSRNPEPEKMFAGALSGMQMDDPSTLRGKTGKDFYSSTKAASLWPDCREARRKGIYEPGRPAFYYETDPTTGLAVKKDILDPSPLEVAKMGALMKMIIARQTPELRLTDRDQLLINEAIHEDEWVGSISKSTEPITKARKLTDFEKKEFGTKGISANVVYRPDGMKSAVPILDDTSGVSGGEQAVPQYFDMEAIRTPLLYGEVVPFVEITPTEKGKAAHSYQIGTPTYVSTASGSAITAFDATGFVTTYDVPFFPASCGIQWGRDFEMDAAPNFGQLLVAQLGDSFKKLMDYWIVLGDGTTQPQGINNASNTTNVPATGTSHQTMVYNDGLNLVYGVDKAHRKAFGGENTMFITSDKEYKKFMQLVTGVTGDQRPIYGMHVKDYQLGDYHVAIQNDIADGTVFFGNLRGYRLYRRLGLYFELITTGQTLTLANLKLLFARARFGGKATRGQYFSYMTGLQIG